MSDSASWVPAKAGIHPIPLLDAGLRRHDKSKQVPYRRGFRALSYSVGDRNLMATSW